jgi:hypothetical protein
MIEKFPQSSGKIFGYRVAGSVTAAEVQVVIDELQQAITELGSVRLLVELEGLPRPELAALWKDLRFTAANLFKIERMVVIGDAAWQEWYTRLGGALVPIKVSYFGREATESAWQAIRHG